MSVLLCQQFPRKVARIRLQKNPNEKCLVFFAAASQDIFELGGTPVLGISVEKHFSRGALLNIGLVISQHRLRRFMSRGGRYPLKTLP